MKITARELRALIAYNAISCYRRERLGKCDAWVIDYHERGIKVLMSFATFVAYYDDETHDVVVFDTYSACTTQHVWKFIALMNKRYGVCTILFPYERKDHLIAIFDYRVTGTRDKGYLRYEKEELPYVNKYVRDESSRELRKREKEEGYESFLSVPTELVDQYKSFKYRYDEYPVFVKKFYNLTIW